MGAKAPIFFGGKFWRKLYSSIS